MKRYLVNVNSYQGISPFWDDTHCRKTWSIMSFSMTTCFPKEPEEENCTVLSSSYNVIEANELYVNIKTETRDFAKIAFIDKCTGRFNLSVYYQINRKDFKRVILPDEIPTKNKSFGERSHFYKTNNDLLGFQAPFYCGTINYVSVYNCLCPAKTNALVDFTEVTAPSKKSSPSISVGTFTNNAVERSGSHHFFMKFYYYRTFEVFSGCECEAGYPKNKKICKG